MNIWRTKIDMQKHFDIKKRKKKPKKVKTLKIDKLKTPTKQTNKQTNTLSYTF